MTADKPRLWYDVVVKSKDDFRRRESHTLLASLATALKPLRIPLHTLKPQP